MDRSWIYVQNPFLNAAGDNFTKFNTILKFTNDRLATQAGDAFFDVCIAIIDPVYTAWKTLFDDWNASESAHKSATLAFKNKLKDLASTEIETWDINIQNVYRKGTPQYINLLPHNRVPFQTGTQEHRMEAVSNLITACGTDAALAAIKALVVTFKTALEGAKTAQTATLTTTDNLSNELDLAIPIAAKALYKVLGKMMDNYSETPTMLESYFDLETIRQTEQITFTKTIPAKKDVLIVKRKLEAEYSLKVLNDSPIDVIIYYCAEKNDAHGSTGKLVPANEEITFAASEAGDLTTGHYLKAYNADALNEAHFNLTIIK